jgi:hypothetical protein
MFWLFAAVLINVAANSGGSNKGDVSGVQLIRTHLSSGLSIIIRLLPLPSNITYTDERPLSGFLLVNLAH